MYAYLLTICRHTRVYELGQYVCPVVRSLAYTGRSDGTVNRLDCDSM